MSDWGSPDLTLESVPFLAVASPRSMARVEAGTRLVSYGRGDVVFDEGDPPSHLYVVRSGAIAVVDVLPDGTEDVLRTVGPGGVLGELGILGGHPRSAMARAAEDSEVWQIQREPFLEAYETEPGIALEIAQVMARYMLDAEAIAEDLLFLDLRGRLAKRLLALADVAGSDVRRVVATDTHSSDQVADLLRQAHAAGKIAVQDYGQMDNLATLAGGTRRSVAELLTAMQGQGLLAVAEGSIVLLDESALEAAARLV